MNLYTLGYQGIDLSTYIQTLKGAGIGLVVDVRETPWSYKRSFCKSALANGLSNAGIEYVHVRSAGNPKENRRTAVSREQCLKRYRVHLRKNPDVLSDLFAVIQPAVALRPLHHRRHRKAKLRVLKVAPQVVQNNAVTTTGKRWRSAIDRRAA